MGKHTTKTTYQKAERDQYGLTDKGRAAMNAMVQRFQQSTVSDLVKVALTPVSPKAPCNRWTFRNQVFAYFMTSCADSRTYKQWQSSGRQVQKGASAGYICTPAPVMKKDEQTGEKTKEVAFMRYSWAAVFPVTCTEVFDPDLDDTDYTPRQYPPLMKVAQEFGLTVKYAPLLDAYGHIKPDKRELVLSTHDFKTFFHELAHEAHRQVLGAIKGGQDAHQETVAEFSAAILMELYFQEDRSGNCWRYIKGYNDDPIKAVMGALKDVGKVLDLILGKAEALEEVPA